MEFTYLLKALLRGKWIIIASVLFAVTAAFVLTRNVKLQFKSTAQLSTGFTNTDDIKLQDDKFNLQQIDVKFNNVIENINSPRVRSLVSYNLMLHDLQSDTPYTVLDEKKMQLPEYKNVDRARAAVILRSKLDSLQILSPGNAEEKKIIKYIELYQYDINSLMKNLQVARYQRTDYINIVYVSGNQFMSAFVVNTVCNEFKRFYGIERGENSRTSITSLDTLVKQKKMILDSKIQDKNLFSSSQNVIDVNVETSNNLSQVGSFESALIEEKGLQKNYYFRVEQLDRLINAERNRKPDNGSSAGSTGSNSEYLRLRNQYNNLNAEYVRSGSSDQAIKDRMDVISRQMTAIELNDVNARGATDNGTTRISLDELIQKKIDAEAQLKASNQKISDLQARIGSLNGSLNRMSGKSADITQLDKEIEIASAEYTDANNRLNLAMSLGSNSQGAFKQTLIGEPALRPESSKRMISMILSGVAALFLSSLVILAIAFFNTSIKTPSNFQRQLGLPLLGVVNNVKFADANILTRVTNFEGEENQRENMFRELLRKLRYEIESSGKQLFLFTSTEPQQGKTSLIQALAYSLSLGKKRVLIIDTNFCNNDLTVAINANPLLEEFQLNGKPFNTEDFKKYVTTTQIPGVDIIGCKGGDYTPSEILPKNHLLNYLGNLREDYDFIFMEGAPLNGFTDTKELMVYAEKVIIIFSAQSVVTPADRESIQFLKDSEKFFGAILNKTEDGNITL